MIRKIDQESLFAHNLDETLNELSISIATATQFFEDGYISFDPSKRADLNEFEYPELRFVCSLFNSGISLESVKFMLSKLDEPYQYDISKVYFNFENKEWEMIPVPEEPSAEELIDKIIDEEDFDRLVDIQDHIQKFLDQNLPE